MGMTHIYFGNGKGKTTAATGLSVRALGHGERVMFVQFLKSGQSGEVAVLKTLPGATLLFGKGCAKFLSQMTEDEKTAAADLQQQNLEKAVEAAKSGGCDLLVLDEVLDVYNLGIIDRDMLRNFVMAKPEGLELVMTGHKLPEDISVYADYITEMKKLRHPFDKGTRARQGVEF